MRKKNLTIILLLTLACTSVIALSPALAIKPSQTQPLDMHGPGYGFYRTSEGYWRGTVWAHYDENGAPDNRQGVWEGGVEGIDWGVDPPISLWYTMGLVDFEHFSGPILIAKGTFGPDAPRAHSKTITKAKPARAQKKNVI